MIRYPIPEEARRLQGEAIAENGGSFYSATHDLDVWGLFFRARFLLAPREASKYHELRTATRTSRNSL